jgi:hypothetical protein
VEKFGKVSCWQKQHILVGNIPLKEQIGMLKKDRSIILKRILKKKYSSGREEWCRIVSSGYL